MNYLWVFCMGFIIDFAYVKWVQKVGEGKRIEAGCASVFIAAPAALGITEIVHNQVMIAPYLLGIFLGTVISVKKES